MKEITALLFWDDNPTPGPIPQVAQFTVRPGKQPIYDLVLQQELALILHENEGRPVSVRITVEALGGAE